MSVHYQSPAAPQYLPAHGALLADGTAPTQQAAEEAAEDEAMAVHPPTQELLERLLT